MHLAVGAATAAERSASTPSGLGINSSGLCMHRLSTAMTSAEKRRGLQTKQCSARAAADEEGHVRNAPLAPNILKDRNKCGRLLQFSRALKALWAAGRWRRATLFTRGGLRCGALLRRPPSASTVRSLARRTALCLPPLRRALHLEFVLLRQQVPWNRPCACKKCESGDRHAVGVATFEYLADVKASLLL